MKQLKLSEHTTVNILRNRSQIKRFLLMIDSRKHKI